MVGGRVGVLRRGSWLGRLMLRRLVRRVKFLVEVRVLLRVEVCRLMWSRSGLLMLLVP